MAEGKYQHVCAHEGRQRWELTGRDQGDGNPSLAQISGPVPPRSSPGAPRTGGLRFCAEMGGPKLTEENLDCVLFSHWARARVK